MDIKIDAIDRRIIELLQKDGKIKITHGESYIGLVRFTPTKTYYESVICINVAE